MSHAPRAARVRRRRAIHALLAASGALAAVAYAPACGGEREGRVAPAAPERDRAADGVPRRGGILSQRLPADPPSLDLHQVTTYTGVWPVAPCFNQLVQFDPMRPEDRAIDIVSDLAARWEQPDPLTLSFTLKDGVAFHDGAGFSAEDVRAQLDWIRRPPPGKTSPRQAALAAIDAVTPLGPASVQIKLKRPAPSLLLNLAGHYFAIGQARDLEANGEIGARLNGTGPFRLKTYQRATLIELERNPTYHVPARPFLDGLRFFILPDLPAALDNFAGGQYQLFYDLAFRASDRARLRLDGGAEVEVEEAPGTLRDPVFTNARRKPFDDLRVRQAIGLAIDRDAAILRLKEGSARRGGYMMPTGAWAIPQEELRRYDGYDAPDPERARALLRAAGVETPLAVSCPTRVDFKEFAEFIRDALARIGIILRLELAETAAAQPLLQRGDFDISPWLIAINVDDPDATFSEIATSSAVRNWSAVKDARIDELFEKQSQTMDFGERRRLVQELERQALSLHQIAVVFFENLTFARDRRVRNFAFHTSLYTNRRMEDVWLAE